MTQIFVGKKRISPERLSPKSRIKTGGSMQLKESLHDLVRGKSGPSSKTSSPSVKGIAMTVLIRMGNNIWIRKQGNSQEKSSVILSNDSFYFLVTV